MTLQMLNGRTYVVSSPALASQIQRASATLDFGQLVVEVTPRMVGLSDETKRIIDDPKSKEENRQRMAAQVMHEVVHPLLAFGKMNGIAEIQLQHFSDFVNAVPNGQEVEFFNFLSREITSASMHTFYGPENPFALHPELIEDFWKWEAGLVGIMMGVFPQWTARDAYIGLNNVAKGFTEYFENGRISQAYELLQRRAKAHCDVGIPIPEQARLEVGISLAFNVNAGITIFWLVNNIITRPSLLAEIREEIRSNALVLDNTISFAALRESCPLLNSAYRETLRFIAPMTSARYVLEDTIINDTYLLRKDTVVQIAGGVIHSDKEIWGPDVDSFNPRRFYYTQSGTKTSKDGSVSESKSSQVHPAAYRAFGGGASLCPGRHFAQIEILTLTAVLLMGFDMEPPAGQEKVAWDPPLDDKRFPIAVMKPLKEVNVKLVRRKGMENIKWVMKY